MGALGRILLYLPLVLLVCYLTVRFRAGASKRDCAPGGDLVLVERLAFGPKQGLAVVRCGNKHFLIGLGEASPRLWQSCRTTRMFGEAAGMAVRLMTRNALLAVLVAAMGLFLATPAAARLARSGLCL